MSENVLELRDVGVRRSNRWILHDVNFTAREGEHWVILGPNGAGKTTMIQIAAARMHPTAGTALVLGEQLGKVDVFELRPRIGLASAVLANRIPGNEKALDAVITGAYAVTGRWRETYAPEDVERAVSLLESFGVGHLIDANFGTMSEGERKRVQIARALMADPEMLLLDEPASGLDLGGREELIGSLAGLATDPHAPVLLLVTHHLEEIPPGFTHACVMKDGTIDVAAPIEQALTAETMSRVFDLPITVSHDAGRFAARAV